MAQPLLLRSFFNTIEENNFINNSYNAFHFNCFFHNTWDKNYWDDHQDGSYVINGYIGYIYILIPWKDIDSNPAQEPYDIGV